MSIEDGAIHLAGFVFKDPQFDDLLCESCRVFCGVAFFDAQQNQDSILDGGMFSGRQ